MPHDGIKLFSRLQSDKFIGFTQTELDYSGSEKPLRENDKYNILYISV